MVCAFGCLGLRARTRMGDSARKFERTELRFRERQLRKGQKYTKEFIEANCKLVVVQGGQPLIPTR